MYGLGCGIINERLHKRRTLYSGTVSLGILLIVVVVVLVVACIDVL